MRRALLAAVALALAVPAVASAHATMKEATPAEQGRVETPPKEVTLRFDQSVVAPADAIVVLGADGKNHAGAITLSRSDTLVHAHVEGLVHGEAYTVRWRIVSADGHVATGVFTFGVGVEAPPPTEAVGSSGMTWRDDVARWALFASLALMIGVVGIRLLVLPRVVDARVERRVHLLGTLGAFLALNAGIAGFVIRSANALQVSGVDLLYADLSPFAESTRFGTAFMVTTLGFGVCLTILVVAWVLDEPRLRWPAFLLRLVRHRAPVGVPRRPPFAVAHRVADAGLAAGGLLPEACRALERKGRRPPRLLGRLGLRDEARGDGRAAAAVALDHVPVERRCSPGGVVPLDHGETRRPGQLCCVVQ